jgi:hypothetical protein
LSDLAFALTPLFDFNTERGRSRNREKNHTDKEEHEREESGRNVRGDKGDYTHAE